MKHRRGHTHKQHTHVIPNCTRTTHTFLVEQIWSTHRPCANNSRKPGTKRAPLAHLKGRLSPLLAPRHAPGEEGKAPRLCATSQGRPGKNPGKCRLRDLPRRAGARPPILRRPHRRQGAVHVLDYRLGADQALFCCTKAEARFTDPHCAQYLEPGLAGGLCLTALGKGSSFGTSNGPQPTDRGPLGA